jgi:hypothetical protein
MRRGEPYGSGMATVAHIQEKTGQFGMLAYVGTAITGCQVLDVP